MAWQSKALVRKLKVVRGHVVARMDEILAWTKGGLAPC